MSKLKPCPFCGGRAYMVTEKTYDGYKTVIYCMSGIDVGCFATSTHWALKKAWAEESAIKAWNHRVNGVCKDA